MGIDQRVCRKIVLFSIPLALTIATGKYLIKKINECERSREYIGVLSHRASYGDSFYKVANERGIKPAHISNEVWEEDLREVNPDIEDLDKVKLSQIMKFTVYNKDDLNKHDKNNDKVLDPKK